MKKGLLLFILFTNVIVFSQNSIKGTIVSNSNQPLEGASVYFNNTSIGTVSDQKGGFELNIKEGNYTLIISFLGYKTKQLQINTGTIKTPLLIQLEEENNILNEVVITKTVYDDEWKYNLIRFKQSFLGRSKLAEECKILNEKDLHFEYNTKTNTLTAIARKPLIIKHYGLGYQINYDLVDFILEKNQLYYSGYARYQNLRKSVRKKWKENRLVAYNGSRMHFLRSLLAKNLKNEGFRVHQFKRVPNPKRPSEEKIKLARELIRLHGNAINTFKKIENPKTPIDSAMVVLQKARLPKFQDFLYKSNVTGEQIIAFENQVPILSFKNYLMIVYKNEPEEANYLKGMFGSQRKASGVQTSNLVLLKGKSHVDKSGVLEAGSFFNEGYWGFESFANMLPLDYIPPKN